MRSYQVTLEKRVTHRMTAKINVEALDDVDVWAVAQRIAESGDIEWSEPVVGTVRSSNHRVTSVDPIVDLDNSDDTALAP